LPSLSSRALKKVNRGWKQMAHHKIVHQNQATPLYTVQATVWKDKKLGILHAMYYNIIKVVACDKDHHPWHKYLSKHLGRYKFQMDSANELISRGFGMDWSDVGDSDKKPVLYMRKEDYMLPCACKACFFCKNGLTTHGVEDHKKKGKCRS
jgi:hypothetical protein